MKTDKPIFEIIFFARGGQGAKTAAELVAQAALREGKFIQAFPDFGPERSGAPMKTYVRISNSPILTHEPVVDPDLVVVVDETLLGSVNVINMLDENEHLIVNSVRTSQEIGEMLKYSGKIHAIDATGLSLEIIGQPRPNTAILGKILKVTDMVQMESLVEVFREKFTAKLGAEMTEKNIKAIEKAYDSL